MDPTVILKELHNAGRRYSDPSGHIFAEGLLESEGVPSIKIIYNDLELRYNDITQVLPPINVRIDFLQMHESPMYAAIPYIVPPIKHPNVSPQDGFMCIGEEDLEWRTGMPHLIWSIAQLLIDPNFSDPIVSSGCLTMACYVRQWN